MLVRLARQEGDHMKCEACGGSGVKLVEGSGNLFMEACPSCNTTGVKDLGFWFDCGWAPDGASPPGLEPWRVRIVEEIGGVVTFRSLQPSQLRQLQEIIKDPFQKNVVTVISELAKTRRELDATKRELDTTRAEVDQLKRRLDSLEATRRVSPPQPESPAGGLVGRLVSKLMGV